MKTHYLRFGLAGGYIHDWLVLGPSTTAIEAQAEAGESELALRTRLLKAADHVTCDFPKPPLEIDKVEHGGEALYWEAEHCQEDHLFERGIAAPVYSRHNLWAFARLSCPGQKRVTIHLSTLTPASVWMNGLHVRYCERLAGLEDQTLQTYSFSASLRPGNNNLLIRLEQVAAGTSVLAVAVRLDDVPLDEVKVLLPTVTEEPERRQEWERAFQYAYVDQAVYDRDQSVQVVCREDMPGFYKGVVRLQKTDGSIYAEIYGTFKSKQTLEGLLGMQLTRGPMLASLMPEPEFYYNRCFRARRLLPFAVSTEHYTSLPVGTYEERLVQTMKEADRSNDSLYAQIAKMSVGWWDVIETQAIRDAIGRVKRGEVSSLDDLLGLVVIRQRMAHYEKFPAELTPEIDECLLGFDYASALTMPCDVQQESDQITLHAAQILAGQIYSKDVFAVSGLTGRKERSRAEELAVPWLRCRARAGFALWNSGIEATVGALAQLADLATDDTVAELSAVLLDKMLFGVAVNSFQGVYGAPRAETRPLWVRSGRFAPETALNYLLWGMGGYNTHFKGIVSLGIAGKNYELPELLRTIALDRWPEMWSRERQQIADEDYANTVAFKTPDYMLASVQDFRAGERGQREHVWQATMGPDAVVFANHPTSLGESDGRRAGWWCGNGVLPRVAQWKDALIAVYNLPDDDWLGFTHAFFPGYAFDEHMVEQCWAFARKGDGYLALRAAQGMELVTMGNDPYRELRSTARRNAWLCQMGRAEVDGSFEDFRKAVLAKSVTMNDLRVEWDTIRGEHLSFGWSGPLLVNGQEQPITGFKHVENPYALAEFPAETMDIGYGQDVMRLHLA